MTRILLVIGDRLNDVEACTYFTDHEGIQLMSGELRGSVRVKG
jgi:hypothetical protein